VAKAFWIFDYSPSAEADGNSKSPIKKLNQKPTFKK
jgi:hypothetical protein